MCYLVVREDGAEGGEAGVDRLHPSPLVAVCNLPPDPFLLARKRTMKINNNDRRRIRFSLVR